MKLAILSLSTFGYFARLSEHLTERGLPAKFYEERPSLTVFSKLVFRFAPVSVAQKISASYLDSIIDEIIAEGYTRVLLNQVELISRAHIQRLLDNGIRVFRYTFDSVGNRPHVRRLDDLLERIGSFDPEDCENFGYDYIPLYSEIVEPAKVLAAEDRNFDFYFCGTMHSERPRLISRAIKAAEVAGWVIQLSLFYHSDRLYLIRNALDTEALSIRSKITSTPFPHAETINASRRSHVIIDVNHPRQAGLTMRSFEALAQGAVLLTTNKYALELIDERLQDRVVILDREHIGQSMAEALSRKSGPLDPNLYHNLSRERFIEDILNLVDINTDILSPENNGDKKSVGEA